MKDFTPKGTGDSRYLKSAIPANTTWEQMRTLLRNGTFPFDFNGVNPAGISEMGMVLNKENLLNDDTADLLGFKSEDDPTVNDAFRQVDRRIKNSSTTFHKLMTGRFI